MMAFLFCRDFACYHVHFITSLAQLEYMHSIVCRADRQEGRHME